LYVNVLFESSHVADAIYIYIYIYIYIPNVSETRFIYPKRMGYIFDVSRSLFILLRNLLPDSSYSLSVINNIILFALKVQPNTTYKLFARKENKQRCIEKSAIVNGSKLNEKLRSQPRETYLMFHLHSVYIYIYTRMPKI